MYKLFTAILFAFIFSITAFAQMAAVKPVPEPTTIANENYRKNEFYVGYSNQQVDTFGRTTFHGVQGAYVRNINRLFGIRADVSYARRDTTLQGSLPNPAGGTYDFQQDYNSSIAQFLGGVQIKDNATTKRFKPFAFALGGVAVNRVEFKNLACTSGTCPPTIPIFNNAKFTDTGLAGSFGGGLDIKVTRKIDFRAFQIDYNPIYSDSRVDNNFRIGIGFVFR
jgi:opacity protein-like surface antigen